MLGGGCYLIYPVQSYGWRWRPFSFTGEEPGGAQRHTGVLVRAGIWIRLVGLHCLSLYSQWIRKASPA